MAERFKFISAVHLFLLDGGRVLLLRRFNTGYQDGKLSVIAGHMDGNETIKAAMIREAREEAGICIDPDDLQIVGVMHRFADNERIDFFLTAETWTGELRNAEPDKCDELAWHSMDDLPGDVIPYVRRAIANYRAGRAFDEYREDQEAPQ